MRGMVRHFGVYRDPFICLKSRHGGDSMNEQVRATGAVVDFITQVKWADFPSDAVALGKRCIADGLGVILAGSTTRGSSILRDYIRTSDGGTEATVIGQQVFRASAKSAALANGASGHAMDFDDTQLS